jgi:hypothetical protein
MQPTEPGYYWARNDCDGLLVVRVDRWLDDSLRVTYHGSDFVDDLKTANLQFISIIMEPLKMGALISLS